MWLTMWMLSTSSTFLGMSAKSFSLSFGMMIVLTPARCAARSFSLTPPIGRTLPRSVISPVIATSRRAGVGGQSRNERRRQRDARGRTVLRNRALGDVHVHVHLAIEVLRDAELLGARGHEAHRRLRRFTHDVAELAGQHQAAAAGHQR